VDAKWIKERFPEIKEPIDSIQSESEATPFYGNDKG
jgi:hypothetical protein